MTKMIVRKKVVVNRVDFNQAIFDFLKKKVKLTSKQFDYQFLNGTVPDSEMWSKVQIEWEDSAQPTSNWVFLVDIECFAAVKCISVGWL